MTGGAVASSMRSEQERLVEHHAQVELRASCHAPLRDIRCSVSDGRIVLYGSVPSFYLKQMAQAVLLSRWGNEFQVENRLDVVPPAAGSRRIWE